jgi:hypothetical protein
MRAGEMLPAQNPFAGEISDVAGADAALFKILLVIFLGSPEGASGYNLGHYRPPKTTGLFQFVS